jgi:hypothetical protein
MADTSLCTDLRRVSSGSSQKYESALTRSLRNSLDQQSPWLLAVEQLSLFPTKRCVQMKPADWQELSAVLGDISSQCAKVITISSSSASSGTPGSSNPSFVATLELLGRLGQVTSCLLCVNGDDRSFSIARVAQVGRMQQLGCFECFWCAPLSLCVTCMDRTWTGTGIRSVFACLHVISNKHQHGTVCMQHRQHYPQALYSPATDASLHDTRQPGPHPVISPHPPTHQAPLPPVHRPPTHPPIHPSTHPSTHPDPAHALRPSAPPQQCYRQPSRRLHQQACQQRWLTASPGNAVSRPLCCPPSPGR